MHACGRFSRLTAKIAPTTDGFFKSGAIFTHIAFPFTQHNFPIIFEWPTQSAKVYALSWEQGGNKFKNISWVASGKAATSICEYGFALKAVGVKSYFLSCLYYSPQNTHFLVWCANKTIKVVGLKGFEPPIELENLHLYKLSVTAVLWKIENA